MESSDAFRSGVIRVLYEILKVQNIVSKQRSIYVVFLYRGLVKWYDRGLQNLWWEFDSLIPCCKSLGSAVKLSAPGFFGF